MKRSIDAIEHAGEIMKKVNDAVLLTTKKDGQVNTMTISWGGMAIEWGKPLFITYVRESRFTKEFLDATGEFTVNLPMGEFDKKITAVCGAKSGRDMDKIAELGLTLEEPEEVNVPGIRELPLTLECRVLFKQEQDLANLDAEDADSAHAQGRLDSSVCLATGLVMPAALSPSLACILKLACVLGGTIYVEGSVVV